MGRNGRNTRREKEGVRKHTRQHTRRHTPGIEPLERRRLLSSIYLNDIYPGGGSDPSAAIEMDGIQYFAATDGTHGRELWRSDGTAAGTYMVKDILPGIGDSYPAGFVKYKEMLYFIASGKIWRSDGTEGGTIAMDPAAPTDLA